MSANVISNQSNISDIFGMEFSGRESLGSPGTVNSPVMNTKCFYGSKSSGMPDFRRRYKEDFSSILMNKDKPKSVDNVRKRKVVVRKRNSGMRNKVDKSKGSNKSTTSVSKKLKDGATKNGQIVKIKRTVKDANVGEENGKDEENLTAKREIDQIISAFDSCSESSSESLASESIDKLEAQNLKPNVHMIVQQICKKYEHLNKEKDFHESKMATDSSEDAQFTDDSCYSKKEEDNQLQVEEQMDIDDVDDDHDHSDYGNDYNDYDEDDKDHDDHHHDSSNNDDYDDHDHNDYDHSDHNHNDSDHDFEDDDSDLVSSLCSYIDAANSLANGLSPKWQKDKHNETASTKTAKIFLTNYNGRKLGNATKRSSTESNFEVSSSEVTSSDTGYGQFCSPSSYSMTSSPSYHVIDSLKENDSDVGLPKNTEQNITEQRDAETLKHKAKSQTSDKATLFGYFERKPKIRGPHEVKETKLRKDSECLEKEMLENTKNEKKLSPYGRQTSLRSPYNSISAVKDMTIEDFAFSDSQSSVVSSSVIRVRKTKTLNRKARAETKKMEQLYIDVGQRDFGHTACATCGMVYTKTLEEDSLHHAKYHQKMMQKLKFKGWKTERIVDEFYDGRIIQINPEDKSFHKKKVDEVREVVDGELGFSYSTVQYKDQEKVFLFISNQRIMGCAIAVLIDEAYPAILAANSSDVEEKSAKSKASSAWCCSSEPVKAVCGISRIWVLKQARRTNVASRLVDAVRINFIFGEVIPKNKLAFSDPTTDGRLFAQNYCGTQNILVFR